MKKTIVYIIVTLLLGSCGSPKQAPREKVAVNGNRVILTPEQYKTADILTDKARQQPISSILRVNGTIDVPPQNMVSISAPLGGYLKFTQLLPGMHLRRGETIAVMEDPQYISLQQDYLTAKAKLLYARQEYERQEELNKTKASSDKVYQQAQADYATEKVLVKALSEKLRLIGVDPDRLSDANLSRSINLTSPIDGYVSAVNANIGKYVNPADILFELVNPEDIHLALNVFEKDVNKLYVGQKVMAYTNGDPSKKYPCKIILIGKDLTQDRSLRVHCHFEQYDHTLLPGMYMNAELEVQSSDAVTVPSDAIVTYDNKQYVFIARGEREYEMTEVKAGAVQDSITEITGQDARRLLAAPVVIKGSYTLLMKLKNSADE